MITALIKGQGTKASWQRALLTLVTLTGMISAADAADYRISPGHCALQVGYESWMPYTVRQDDGDPAGMDVDLLRALAQKLGCRLSFHEEPWKRVLQGVAKGEFDVVTGASITDERAAFGRFSQPFRQQTIGLFMRKGELPRLPIKNFQEIVDYDLRVGTTLGYEYGGAFDLVKDDPRFSQHVDQGSDTETGFRKLLVAKRIDGFIDDLHSGSALANKLGLGDKVAFHPAVIRVEPAYALFSKKTVSPEFVAAFDQALGELRRDGTLQKIDAAYRPGRS